MIILGIETSTSCCSIGILINNKIIEKKKQTNNNQSKYILSMINDILQKNKITINNINFIAYGIGPGSFTGIRIATSIAFGFNCAINIPIIGISSLHALAQESWETNKVSKIMTTLHANMTRIFYGLYKYKSKNLNNKTKDNITYPESIKINEKNCILVGNIKEKHIKIILDNNEHLTIDKKINYPKAKYIIKLARLKIKLKEHINKNYLPIYYS